MPPKTKKSAKLVLTDWVRSICWTLNNPSENGGSALIEFLDDRAGYYCFGRETGDSGTFHWQGYAEFKSSTRGSLLMGEKRPCNWHVERRCGSQEEAIAYCNKGGAFTERGDKNAQGARTDLGRAQSIAAEGGLRELSKSCSYQQYCAGKVYLTHNEVKRTERPYVAYITGPSGAGKSRMAWDWMCAAGLEDDVYWKKDSTVWWDGYDGQQGIIIDDFRDDWWELTYLLSLLDWMPHQIQVKGAMRQIRAERVYITSIVPLPNLRWTGENMEQLYRRIDTYFDMSDGETPPKNDRRLM